MLIVEARQAPTDKGGRTASGLDDRSLAVVQEIAIEAVDEVREWLPTLVDDLVLAVFADDRVIPETGEAGASVSPGRIEWHADPATPGGVISAARRELRFTLFHELHHQVRGWVMRGGTPPSAFIDAPIAEGLASAFERDAAGRRAPWAEYPVEVGAWVDELLALPLTANYAQWMFKHPDGRRWIGYRAGTYVADRARMVSGLSAAQLVATPTAAVLDLAGYRLPEQAS